MKNFSYILAPFFLLFFVACGSPLDKGGQAPDFKLKDTGKQVHSLSQYKGKVVLLHFWTDWCNACRAEFPRIQEFYEALKSDDFELVAVNVGQAASVSQTFKKDFRVSFPMLTDEQSFLKDLYKIEAYPTNYFIDKEGRVIRKIIGWVDKQQVEVIIKQHR